MLQKSLVYILTTALFLSSCSMFNWSRAPLHVMTSEDDAKIYINGEYRGQGNIQTYVPRHTNVSILA